MRKKRILITGAASGLGKELSLMLANDAHDLYLLSKSKEKLQALQSEIKGSIQIYPVDFENESALENVLVHLIETNLIPDVIIHCAGGGFKMRDPLLTRQEFLTLLNINLTAIVHMNSKLIPKMIEQGGGVVIHIGSTAAHAAHGSVAYNTAKAALAAYVRSLGRALAAKNVVVTGISPGSFMAEGNNMSDFRKNKPVEFETYEASLPSKRIPEVQEFFQIIHMLCHQKTSLFSGCMLPVDAGEGMSYTY